MEPDALLSHLPKADGSATFSYAGYTIIGAVNGPIEVQRKDELPDEAVVDVIVRPGAGVGGTRERHLESLLQSTLRRIILVNNFPRTLIQVILQVTITPENDYVNSRLVQANTNLPMLPALLQTAVLALLSAALPLESTLTACGLAITSGDGDPGITIDPSPRDIEASDSFHVFAFTPHHDLILSESDGSFTWEDWNRAYELASKQCCAPTKTEDADTSMSEDGLERGADMNKFLRSVTERKVANDIYWK